MRFSNQLLGRVWLMISLLCVFMAATFAGAAITYVGDIGAANIKDSGTADLVITTTAAVAAGNTILIAYATDPNQDLTITITDAAGNAYQMAAMAISQGNCRTFIYAAYNVVALASGSAITINQVFRNSDYAVAARAAVASVFSGVASMGALEQTCVGSGTSTSPSSGAATTVAADQLLIGAVGTEGPSGDTAGSWSNSFTALQRTGTTGGTDATTNITVSMGYRIVSSAGSYTAAKTGIISRDWAAAIASFKMNASGISFIRDLGAAQSKTAGTSLTITTTAAVSAGDDIIVTFATDPAGAVSSISDGSNTYNQVVDVTNSGNVRTMIYAAYNVAALASGATITINHASTTARVAQVLVFRGLANSSVLDQTHTGTGNGTTASSGATSTTTQASELLIGAVGREGPHSDAPGIWGNSFSARLHLGTNYGTYGGDDTNVALSSSFRIVGATAAYTASMSSFADTRDWSAVIATLKAETGTPTYTLTAGNDGNGTVTLSPSGGTYSSGTTVTLTPVPNSGYVFASWSGANVGDIINTSGVYTIVMNTDKSVIANFSPAAEKRGDVNSDDTASSTDALIVLSCDVGIDASAYCPMNCGDVNGDGWVNSTDALIILSYDVGLSVPYPVGQAGCEATVTQCAGCN